MSLTDIVFPTTGPTAGVIDDDDKSSDETAEAEMGESDVTDEDSDDEEMEADAADVAHVSLLLINFLHLSLLFNEHRLAVFGTKRDIYCRSVPYFFCCIPCYGKIC